METGVFQIFLSSAVIAALITSLFSYQASRETNKRLISIELIKRESELTTFRYLTIYSALEDLYKLPDISYIFGKLKDNKFTQDKELFKNVIVETTERYNTVVKIFGKVKSLMDEKFLSNVISAMEEVKYQSDLLTKAIYTNSPLPDGVDTITLTEARKNVEILIVEALSLQVSALTKITSVTT
jgi:hypothetical protein